MHPLSGITVVSVEQADVFGQNLAPGAVDRLGLDTESPRVNTMTEFPDRPALTERGRRQEIGPPSAPCTP